MKTEMKALELVEKGLSIKTVKKLTESQIEILHKKLFVEQTATGKGVTMVSSKNPQAPKIANDLNKQGVNVQVTEKELDEEDDVTIDPNKDTETQDPHQVGPSTNDGFNNDDDGMYNFESIEEAKSRKRKKKTKKETNPWAICTAQLGKEFGTRERSMWSAKEKNKYERCVKDVKKSLKEGKENVSLYLENQIMKIVERNLPPRITKGDLLKYLSESEPAVAPSKPGTKEKPGTDKPSKSPRPKTPAQKPDKKPNPAPKAVSFEVAKEKVLDLIDNLLNKG